VDRTFQEIFLRFMYHLERVNWRKKETVLLLLEDVREMEAYLKEITQKKGDGNE